MPMKRRYSGGRVAVCLGTAAALGLAAAPAAMASSVSGTSSISYSGSDAVNTVAVAPASGGGITITDSENITGNAGNCTGSGTTTVTCPGDTASTPPVQTMAAFLGGGDDTFSSTALLLSHQVSGGEGNDTLTGAPGPNGLQGGAGDDKLTGGLLGDQLSGG